MPAEPTLSLVPFAAIDTVAVAALVNAAFRRYAILESDRTSPEGLADEAGDDAEWLLAHRAGRLVGSAMIRPAAGVFAEHPNPAALGDVSTALYFGLAAVEPLEMSSGIGRRLVAEAERIAAERGYRSVILGTLREFGLVDYYARFGYVVVAVHDFEAGHWDIVVPHRLCEMVKAL
jgi:predicted N-acetyltransferase YhbS